MQAAGEIARTFINRSHATGILRPGDEQPIIVHSVAQLSRLFPESASLAKMLGGDPAS